MIPTTTPAINPTDPMAVPAPSIDELVQSLSLEQKIGQVMIIGFDGTSANPELVEMVTKHHVGGVILFARNVESPAQVAKLTADLQKAALDSGHPALFTAIDQEGGRVARLTEDKNFTEFPGAMALGATGDPELARQVARAMAVEMKSVGINIDFAPDLDVNNNPANPVIGIRSYGSDPVKVAQMGQAFFEGLQSEGVLAFGKHFPGHGDTGVDSHVNLPLVGHNLERLNALEFVPFKAAIQAGIAGIMSAHVAFPAIEPKSGLAATLSSKVMTDLLRNQLKFEGLLVTDSLEMGALGQSGYPPPLAAATAFQAGADLILFNRDHTMHKQVIGLMMDWVKSGKISEARLNESVKRVIAAKMRYIGLKNESARSQANYEKVVFRAAHRNLSLDVAQKSITLLRDVAKLLPLKTETKLLVVETSAGRGLGKAMNASFIQVADQPSAKEIEQVVNTAADGRTIIFATTDAGRNPAQVALATALLKAKIPVVVVAMRSPYDLLAMPEVSTYLATYGSPPATLTALAKILYGEAPAGGKLPVDITR